MSYRQRSGRSLAAVALAAVGCTTMLSLTGAGLLTGPNRRTPSRAAAATPPLVVPSVVPGTGTGTRPIRLGFPAAGRVRPALPPARAADRTHAHHAGAGAHPRDIGPPPALGPVSPASGILPPRNPSSNIPPDPNFLGSCTPGGAIDDSTTCLATTLSAVDHARATEPVPAMRLSIRGLQHLTVAEQIFAITDLERVARGLPPIADLTSQLDTVAATGANRDTDPLLGGATPAGGGFFESWGSNWAGGTFDSLVSDYYWMYDDGYGSGNLSCTAPSSPGCWGHRDNILGTYLFGGACGGATTLVMGAAATSTPSGSEAPSFAEILAGQCGRPTGVVMTWKEAEQAVMPRWVVGMAPTRDGDGYWIADSAGKVWNYGDAPALGDLTSHVLDTPVSAIAADPATDGFWLVTAGGGVYGFGAPDLGGEGGTKLNAPIVGMAPTWDGRGYWLVASDGGLFGFGDARFHGSEGGHPLNAPIVGIAADPRTGGYWMVASDGGIFAFDAPFLGSEGGQHLNARIVGMSVAGGGTGYRFVASDGGIFSFQAPFYGSEGGSHLNQPITAMATDRATGGYWLVAADGGMFAFHAPFKGSPA